MERRKLIKAYGAELVLTSGADGMKAAIAKAQELAKEIPDSFIPAQFENRVNTQINMETTGPEMYEDMDGNIDIFVSAIGTGGTIMGVGKYLKSKKLHTKIIGVEPAASAILSGGSVGEHKIEGIGPEFVPELLNTLIYDEMIPVENEEAFEMARFIGKKEGILVGISSGAVLHAAVKLAKREENQGKNIVVIFADSGDRYLSTPLFEE